MLIRSKHEGYRLDGTRIYPSDGPKTPPPDPELVQAQINNMNIQAEAAKAIMGHANSLMPLQREALGFGLQAARTDYADSREDRKYTLERRGQLTKLQNQQISDAQEWNTPLKEETMAATAGADAEQQMGIAEQERMRTMTRMGVNPASGNFGANTNAASIAKAGIKTAAINGGRADARQEGRALTDRAASSLSGYPALSLASTAQTMQAGALPLTTVNQALGGIGSIYNSAGASAGGAASTAAQLYGTQAGMYNTAQNNAAQEDSAMWGAAGTAAMLVVL